MQPFELLRKALSPIYYGLGIYQRNWKKQAKDKACIAVLCYHRIVATQSDNRGLLADEVGVPSDVFEKQMRFMLKHFKPIKPSEVLSVLDKPGLYFAVTFDDGFGDNYSVAAAILSKLGISGGFFVVSDFIDTDKLFWWEQLAYMIRETTHKNLDIMTLNPQWVQSAQLDKYIELHDDAQKDDAQKKLAAALRHTPPNQVPHLMSKMASQLNVELKLTGRDYPMMTWQQLNDLKLRGFDIGGHTATHVNLGEAAPSDYQAEIYDATATLEKGLNGKVPTFAYPYGTFAHYTSDATNAVVDANYECAFTTNHGIIDSTSHPFQLPRFKLNKSLEFACAYNVANAFVNK